MVVHYLPTTSYLGLWRNEVSTDLSQWQVVLAALCCVNLESIDTQTLIVCQASSRRVKLGHFVLAKYTNSIK